MVTHHHLVIIPIISMIREKFDLLFVQIELFNSNNKSIIASLFTDVVVFSRTNRSCFRENSDNMNLSSHTIGPFTDSSLLIGSNCQLYDSWILATLLLHSFPQVRVHTDLFNLIYGHSVSQCAWRWYRWWMLRKQQQLQQLNTHARINLDEILIIWFMVWSMK